MLAASVSRLFPLSCVFLLRTLLQLLYLLHLCHSYCWLPIEVAEWAIEQFHRREDQRSRGRFERPDRRSSSPFITGNGFRELCKHRCDDTNHCNFNPNDVNSGEHIFIKSDFYEKFVTEKLPDIKNPHIIVSHNGDLSAPDGQVDYHASIGMPVYKTSHLLAKSYNDGILIAHHGQNVWWSDYNTNNTRPEYLHCLPIGLENRQYTIGSRVHVYVEALKRNVIDREILTSEEEKKKPLLLVGFTPKDYAPDRLKVLLHLKAKSVPDEYLSPSERHTEPFYHEVHTDHKGWLDNINQHRFVLAPFGHGLDTHRISEILLMGGIPVMRKSSISSCFDDSDNTFGNSTRGSLPVVILESWKNLTVERLEWEWDRITKYPKSHWDWRRLFIDHWLTRIGLQ